MPGHLLHNLILFGRVLRGLGLEVNTARMMDLTQSLSYIDVGLKLDFYYASRALLVHRREDILLFDQAFEIFWQKLLQNWEGDELFRSRSRYATSGNPLSISANSESERLGGDEPSTKSELPSGIEVARAYSPQETLRQRDFGDLNDDEIGVMEGLIDQLVWQLGHRSSRRHRQGSGARIDWRHTFRHSLRYGGNPIQLAWQERKVRPRPLVVIADISGSMERYTQLLLHFNYCVTQVYSQRVEVFTFGTKLTHLSHQMQEKNRERALTEVSDAVVDWAGGTRIGESLKTFNAEWACRVLRGGAVVMLISDGWDRGDPKLLATEMAFLQRSCYRLIWLNPLLGLPGYEPLGQGMHAALPYLDDFLPIHNLTSLEALAKYLIRLDRRRTVRRAVAHKD